MKESRLPAQKWPSARIAQRILAKLSFEALHVTLKKWQLHTATLESQPGKAQRG
jgi:hypothetical protein